MMNRTPLSSSIRHRHLLRPNFELDSDSEPKRRRPPHDHCELECPTDRTDTPTANPRAKNTGRDHTTSSDDLTDSETVTCKPVSTITQDHVQSRTSPASIAQSCLDSSPHATTSSSCSPSFQVYSTLQKVAVNGNYGDPASTEVRLNRVENTTKNCLGMVDGSGYGLLVGIEDT